ncbi:putative MFS family arabinose efflux permease [Streptomyces sp. AK010]|nr:putative MFS family arabinose efflux permease [Streptomyces sp. AK010]
MPSGLIALALGGFGIGLTEFLTAGLLPQVASSLGVSEAAAGWLISGYALSVAVGAIALTAATARLPRKHILVGLVALFVIGNLLSAVAPNYQVMLLGRIVAALCHGSFFGSGGVAISAGLGYTAPLYVGAGIVLMSVPVMVVAAQRARSSQAADRVPAR